MRIAVLADTHLSLDLARKALRQAGPVDEVFHLGDFYADALALAKEIKTPLAAVRGNTDFEEGPNDLVLERLGHRLFLTHGHYYDVPETLDRLVAAARLHHCSVALFGHSHLPLIERRSGLLLVNPGSLFFPEANKTFAILDLLPGQAKARIISLNGLSPEGISHAHHQ
jgi:hypothetical protein